MKDDVFLYVLRVFSYLIQEINPSKSIFDKLDKLENLMSQSWKQSCYMLRQRSECRISCSGIGIRICNLLRQLLYCTCLPELNPLVQPLMCRQHEADLRIVWLSPNTPGPVWCGSPPRPVSPACPPGLQWSGLAVNRWCVALETVSFHCFHILIWTQTSVYLCCSVIYSLVQLTTVCDFVLSDCLYNIQPKTKVTSLSVMALCHFICNTMLTLSYVSIHPVLPGAVGPLVLAPMLETPVPIRYETQVYQLCCALTPEQNPLWQKQ